MAEGDIGAVLASLLFSTTAVESTHIVHVTGDVYAISHSGPDNDGWITTVTIGAAGAIALVAGGSLEFDIADGILPRNIHVSGDVFAIVYTGTDGDGWIKTVTIDAAGALALVAGGSLEFDIADGNYSDIIHVSGDVYAIAYRGVLLDGWIKTVTIDAAGAIALVAGESLEFDEVYGNMPRIIHVSGDVFAIAYSGPDIDGWIKTVTIDAAGALALVAGGSLEFDIARCEHPNIIHVAGDVFAISYQGDSGYGWITTVTISAGGALALVAGGSLRFYANIASWPILLKVSGDKYVLCYGDVGDDGWMVGLTITDAGVPSLTALNVLEFETSYALKPDIIHISGDVYAVAYQGPSANGTIKTISIETIALVLGKIHHMLMMGVD